MPRSLTMIGSIETAPISSNVETFALNGGTIDSSIDRQAFMAIYSPLRSRRLAAQSTEATQRLITFKLSGENFALPLNRIKKVTTLDLLYPDPNGTGVCLTTYQDKEVLVIDAENRIFGKPQQIWLPGEQEHNPAVGTHPKLNLIKYLLILQSEPVDPLPAAIATEPTAEPPEDRLVGLTIDSPPSIQSMPLSAFYPLSDIYRQQMHCVSGMSNAIPTNALLRKRVWSVSGTSMVAANTAHSAETNSPQSNQSTIFLLDATSIVGG
jgi:hypothetical protein